LQAAPRGLFKKSTPLLTAGETAIRKVGTQIPDGTILGARGPHGVFAPDNALNRWFKEAYQQKHGDLPNYPAYHMAQAILALKAAYEKAQGSGGAAPSPDAVVGALEKLEFETPSGTIRMALGKGHQAIEETAYGVVKNEGGKVTLTNVKRFPADKVNPPEGQKSADWIKSSLKK
jgi:branched-chain amino acid transport system substrate-binding protein